MYRDAKRIYKTDPPPPSHLSPLWVYFYKLFSKGWNFPATLHVLLVCLNNLNCIPPSPISFVQISKHSRAGVKCDFWNLGQNQTVSFITHEKPSENILFISLFSSTVPFLLYSLLAFKYPPLFRAFSFIFIISLSSCLDSFHFVLSLPFLRLSIFLPLPVYCCNFNSARTESLRDKSVANALTCPRFGSTVAAPCLAGGQWCSTFRWLAWALRLFLQHDKQKSVS
jgi:hypothetical protein